MHEGRGQCCSEAATTGGSLGIPLYFLWCGFPICQLAHHPVPVEEIKSVPIHTLCCASLYTLYLSVSFCIEWQKQKVFFHNVKVLEGAGIYDIAVPHVVG